MSALNSVDFPTLGSQTIPIFILIQLTTKSEQLTIMELVVDYKLFVFFNSLVLEGDNP